MEEKIQQIVARFIKLSPAQLTDRTAIDRTAIGSSIMLHRMYGALANEGIVVPDYYSIKDYGTLIQRINGSTSGDNISISTEATADSYQQIEAIPGVGIDMEKIAAMPVANDFREDAFYKMNFAPSEIAYCILQSNPLASFAGLFAAKEALVKADNSYKDHSFNTIVIDHLPSGKPVHKDFLLSISHTNDAAIAIAMRSGDAAGHSNLSLPQSRRSFAAYWLIAFALLLAAVLIWRVSR